MFSKPELKIIQRTLEMHWEIDHGIDTTVDQVNIPELCAKIEGLLE